MGIARAYPRITVVTPSFESERFIESTIQSVLSQQYPNLEYMVLDGGGADGTRAIVERYGSRLAYWRSQPDDGQYPAINEGFARATGDVYCWLNSDDLLLPRSLFVVAEIFSTLPFVNWISTLRPGNWDANGSLSGIGTIPGFSKTAFLDGVYLPGTVKKTHWIQQESTFFRRELWERAGARIPEYSLAGDFALWCEFYKHADLYGVDYPLAGFRHVEGQKSEAMKQYVAEARRALDLLRNHYDWSGSVMNSVRFSRYADLLSRNAAARKRLAYKGGRVVNANPRKPGAEWKIEEHAFLP